MAFAKTLEEQLREDLLRAELRKTGMGREVAGRHSSFEFQDAQRQRRIEEEQLKGMRSQRQMTETGFQEQLRESEAASERQDRQLELQEEAAERAGPLSDIALQSGALDLQQATKEAGQEDLSRSAGERARLRVNRFYENNLVPQPHDIERIYSEEGAEVPLDLLSEQRKRALPGQQQTQIETREAGQTERANISLRKQQIANVADIGRDFRRSKAAEDLEAKKFRSKQLLAGDRSADAKLDRQLRAEKLGLDERKLKLAEDKYRREANRPKLLKGSRRPEDAAVRQVLKRADAQSKLNDTSNFDESINAAVALYGHDPATFKLINSNIKRHMKSSGLSDSAISTIYIEHGYNPATFELFSPRDPLRVNPRSQQTSQGLTGGRAPTGRPQPVRKGHWDPDLIRVVYD